MEDKTLGKYIRYKKKYNYRRVILLLTILYTNEL